MKKVIILLSFNAVLISCQQIDIESPNVIIIMTDDQGFGDFGVTGNDIIETPAINRFAAESVFFNRFYVSPVCAPTRATLLTGRYYLRTGVTGVTGGEETKIEIRANGKSLVKEIEEPFVPEAYSIRDQVDRGRPPEMKWKNFSWGIMQLQKGEYNIEVRAKEIPGSKVREI